MATISNSDNSTIILKSATDTATPFEKFVVALSTGEMGTSTVTVTASVDNGDGTLSDPNQSADKSQSSLNKDSITLTGQITQVTLDLQSLQFHPLTTFTPQGSSKNVITTANVGTTNSYGGPTRYLKEVTAGVISGTIIQKDDVAKSISPFTALSILDGSTSREQVQIVEHQTGSTTPTDTPGKLTGDGISETSPGVYAIQNGLYTVVADLRAATFTPTAAAAGQDVHFDITMVNDQQLTTTDTQTVVQVSGVPQKPPPPPPPPPPGNGLMITDNTANPLFVLTGQSLPFTNAITVVDPNQLDDVETVIVTLKASGDKSLTNTNLGTISDPNGGGTFDAKTGTFVESGLIAGDPTFATNLLHRLQYNAPKLVNGQSAEITATVAVQDSSPVGPAVPTTFIPAPNTISQTVTDPTPITVDTVTPPSITGTVANQPLTAPNSVKPFSTVSIADNDFNQQAQDIATIKLTDTSGKPVDLAGFFSGSGLSETSPGVYTLPNAVSPSTLTTELQALVLTAPNAASNGQTIKLELDVQDVPPGTSSAPTGFDATKSLVGTDTKTSVLIGGGQKETSPCFQIVDQTTGQTTSVAGDQYTGPVSGIEDQFIVPAATISDNLNVTALCPSVFIKTGSGDDALDMGGMGGTNVLDGSTGSNFMTGGSGHDTFFLDDRNPSADVWTTVKGMHAGDDATIWGITQAMFAQMTEGDNVLAIAPGLDFSLIGKPTINLTLSDYSTADLKNGRLGISFGHTPDLPGLPGSDYMQIHANA